MDKIWLTYNPRSRVADDALVEQIEAAFAEAAWPIEKILEIGEGPDVTAAMLREAGVGVLVLLSGDGSINALASGLGGWEGALLVLPGGTMNLLSKALHGETAPLDIVGHILAGQARRQTVPIIEHGDMTAYTGIIAGPTAAWGDVREDLRKGDIAALGQDALHAVSATFDEPGVCVDGADERYPAIFLEPGEDALKVSGVRAEHAGQLFAHGWAWLMGDFRKGPFQQMKAAAEVTLEASGRRLALLVDGEQAKTGDPATFRSGRSTLHFLSTRELEA